MSLSFIKDELIVSAPVRRLSSWNLATATDEPWLEVSALMQAKDVQCVLHWPVLWVVKFTLTKLLK